MVSRQRIAFVFKMEDRCYVLLQKVVEENSRLRATIEARDAQQQRLFEELSSKLESTHSGQTKQSRKRTRPINVPQQCRVSTPSFSI